MACDVLSDVLRNVRLRGAVYYHVGGDAAWAAEAPPARDIAAVVMPGVEHVMEYHVLTRGECWGSLVGETPVRLQAGDILLFPHGDPHVMSSAPGMRVVPGSGEQFLRKSGQLPFLLAHGGAEGPRQVAEVDGYGTTLVCGFLGCDLRPFNPLVARLPRLLHLRAGAEQAWIAHFMRHAVDESTAKRAGGEAMLERMSEMMFIDAVRRYVDLLPPGSPGWLAGLRDPFVGKALGLLHAQPGEPWTPEELGRRIGLSRSALHERFAALIGQPPMQYLTSWRMQVAANHLRDSNATVAAVALEVGYESEAAFSRAFKRLVGVCPAAWRRRHGKRDAALPEY